MRGAVSLSFMQKAWPSQLTSNQTDVGPSQLPPGIRLANGRDDDDDGDDFLN